MYENMTTSVAVQDKLSDEFEVKVGAHQGSVLSPLLFIIALKALSKSFRSGLPCELLYADGLVKFQSQRKVCLKRLKLEERP